VYYVVDTVVDQLLKDPKRHFIYVSQSSTPRCGEKPHLSDRLLVFTGRNRLLCPLVGRAGKFTSNLPLLVIFQSSSRIL
jgi:hypothetical protein